MVPAAFFPNYCIKCEVFTSSGGKISRNIDAQKSFYDQIKNNFWFANNILTQVLKYGIEIESLVVNLYMGNTGNKVNSSGLWVKPTVEANERMLF